MVGHCERKTIFEGRVIVLRGDEDFYLFTPSLYDVHEDRSSKSFMFGAWMFDILLEPSSSVIPRDQR